MSERVPANVTIRLEDVNRWITYDVNDIFNQEELDWRTGLAVKQLKKDLAWLEQEPKKQEATDGE